MKTLREFLEEAKKIAPMVEEVQEPVEPEEGDEEGDEDGDEEQEPVNEAADIELKPHENGTHYIVHKIHPKSGIESDQLKSGEKISDTHVDDLHDMGYNVKIHKK
jgi:hypothetical protein